MATKMPLRVALANATLSPAQEEKDVASEVYHSLPAGLRRAGETLIGAPKELYDWANEPEGRAFPREIPMPAQPAAPQAAPPLSEPTKPPPKQVVSEAARQAAELYREVGPQPPARPAAPVEPPTSYARVKLPSGEWAEAGSPSVAGAFGKDNFASSRSAAVPESTSSPDQQLDWMNFLDVRDRQRMAEDEERAGAEARTASARATTARAKILEQAPFYAEDTAARANLGKAAVEAHTESTRRNFIENTIQKAEARINQLRNDPLAANPKYAQWDPQRRRQHYEQLSPEERAKVSPSDADRKAAEEQIMQEVFLALGALTRTNLSPRASNPLEGLLNATASGAEPKKE